MGFVPLDDFPQKVDSLEGPYDPALVYYQGYLPFDDAFTENSCSASNRTGAMAFSHFSLPDQAGTALDCSFGRPYYIGRDGSLLWNAAGEAKIKVQPAPLAGSTTQGFHLTGESSPAEVLERVTWPANCESDFGFTNMVVPGYQPDTYFMACLGAGAGNKWVRQDGTAIPTLNVADKVGASDSEGNLLIERYEALVPAPFIILANGDIVQIDESVNADGYQAVYSRAAPDGGFWVLIDTGDVDGHFMSLIKRLHIGVDGSVTEDGIYPSLPYLGNDIVFLTDEDGTEHIATWTFTPLDCVLAGDGDAYCLAIYGAQSDPRRQVTVTRHRLGDPYAQVVAPEWLRDPLRPSANRTFVGLKPAKLITGK
jgi:hypothetical protein